MAEYIVAIDVTRVRFPADAVCLQVASKTIREQSATSYTSDQVSYPNANLALGIIFPGFGTCESRVQVVMPVFGFRFGSAIQDPI